MLTIVLQHGCEHVGIGVVVPLVCIVVKSIVGAFLVVPCFFIVGCGHGTRIKLHVASAAEGLRELCHCLYQAVATGVEFGQKVEVHLMVEVAGGVLPLTYLLFVGTFLIDESDGVDTFVHADGVLPVVGALCELRVVLDAHSFAGTHVSEHHLLFDATYLIAGLVVVVAHLLNAIAREIALGGARIANGHGEVALLVAVKAHACPTLGVVGHVVLGVRSRPIGLRVGIDAEHREVAGLSRPHPVVGLAAELTH